MEIPQKRWGFSVAIGVCFVFLGIAAWRAHENATAFSQLVQILERHTQTIREKDKAISDRDQRIDELIEQRDQDQVRATVAGRINQSLTTADTGSLEAREASTSGVLARAYLRMIQALRQVERNGLVFNVRENTMDEWIVNEVTEPRTYLKHLEIGRWDVVLDIGMNIGVFSVLAGRAAARVIGYEPDEGNYDVAASNVRVNKLRNAVLHNLGVSDSTKRVRLYLNEKKNRGQHTTTPVSGRRSIEIECVGINDVLKTYRPTKIKIDCEGEEAVIIPAVKDWYDARSVVFEWHRKLLHDEGNVAFHRVLDSMAPEFDVVANRDGKGWYQFVRCYRKAKRKARVH